MGGVDRLRTMTVRTLAIALFVACAGFVACTRVEPVGQSGGEGGGAALMKNLLRARELEIVVEEKDAREPLERAAARLRRRDTLQFEAVVHATPYSGSAPRIVVGTAASISALNLVQSIGVTVSVGTGPIGERTARFRYANREFAGLHDGLIATFADAQRPGLPITLVFANDVATAVELAGSLMPGWKPWIRVVRAGDLALAGPIEIEGTPRRPDLVRLGGQELAAQRQLRPTAALGPGVIGQSANDISDEVLARYVRACVAARENVASWCAPDAVIPPANVRLWSRADDYCTSGDPRSLSRFEPAGGNGDGGVDALVSASMDDGGAGVARAGAWRMLGAPAQPWMLDAVGVDAAWSWWGRDLDAWLARVLPGSASSAHVGIADLIDAQALERTSVHVISPLRGALWRFLRERNGPAFVRQVWNGTRGIDATVELDAAFDAWLRVRTQAAAISDTEVRARMHAAALAMPMMRGVATCEPAYDARDGLRRGLGSRAFDTAVEAARADGADALSITAFACDSAGLPALFDDAHTLELGLRDGDVRVAAALARARAAGMRTLLSPEFLTADAGTWSGTWSRGDHAQWSAFFERYARFVEHTALLAELSGADVLSVGSGLLSISGRDAEGRRPVAAEADWKRDGWKRVISLARSAFPGALVYSATTLKELESIAYFRDLDFIGFQLVPTLEFDDPWDDHDAMFEIRQNVGLTLAVLGRVSVAADKRVLLTQACFSPDLHGAARSLGSGTASRAWQARQFTLLAGSLREWQQHDRLAGLFAWRVTSADEADSIGVHDAVIADPRVRSAVSGLLRSL